MKWLREVLARNAILDLETEQGRDVLAEAIMSALPKHVVAAAIRESTLAVLVQKQASSGPDTRFLIADVAREIGNNAAASVLLMLQVDEDDDPGLDTRFDSTDADAPRPT